MALVIKINPTGVDCKIDTIQKKVYDFLANKIGWTNYESYHRAYKNYKDGQLIPEVYVSANEYAEILFNDKFNATSFFLASDDRRSISNGLYEQKVSLIYQIKLDKIYPAILHRADEESHIDVLKALASFHQEDLVTNVVTGADNVYNDLTLSNEYKDKIRLTDMSNFHVFKIDLKLTFQKTCC